MRALLAVVCVIGAATTAQAAPWSVELPAGYTEQPGAGDAEIEQLRKVPRTVSADAQVYLSPDGNVRLTRMTWLSKFDVTPTRANLESMERGVLSGGAKHATKNISDTRSFVGDQLVADQVLEVEATRIHMKRLYAADTAKVVHMFTVVCAGPADQLADCEKAQQSMQLVLPNQASLTGEPPVADTKKRRNTAYVIGQLIGAAILVGLVLLWVRSGAPIWRRPPKR